MKRALFFILCIYYITSQVTIAETLPTEAFVQLPDVEMVELSPSGNKLAILKRTLVENKRLMVLEVTDLASGKKTYPVIKRKNDFNVYKIIWASDRHILLKVDFFKQLKRENTGWNPLITERRLMVLDLETNTLKNIISKLAFKRFEKKGWQPQFQDKIVDLLPDEPNFILHALDWNARQSPKVFKVNLTTLKRESIEPQKENWFKWVSDQQGKVRVGVSKKAISGGLTRDRSQYDIHVKDISSGKWKTLWTYNYGDANSIKPLGFMKDPNILLVEALHEGRDAIFKVDLRQPDKRELFYSSKKLNVGGNLFYSPRLKEPVGYHTTGGISFWDETYIAFDKVIDKALSTTTNYLKALSTDETKYLVYAVSDVDSGTYYLGDRKAKTLNPVAYRHMALDPSKLASSKKQRITARDGKKIKIFVTTPKEAKDDQALPTVIYSNHGQSNAYKGGFDFRTQLLINQGYRVIQVNFRKGTGGYYNFMQGSIDNWGDQLYQDINDVATWANKKGLIKDDKLCLLGSAYAGYAALMAAATAEYAYTCVATLGAMTDIRSQLVAHEGFSNYEIAKAQLSNKRDIQKQYSPTHHASAFTASTLLIHGTKDSEVRSKQGAQLYKALKKAKKDVEYVEIEKDDSILTTDKNRIHAYRKIEAFFAKHLQ